MSEEKPKKKNTSKIIIIILLVLIVVGGAAFGGMMLAGKKGSTTTTAKAPVITEVTYSLDEFLVNLADNSDTKSYLKVLIYVGYAKNSDLATELETQKPVIRDLVIKTLREKKSTSFTDTGVDVIKKEIIARINPVLTKGKIDHIYFNDLLVQ